MFLWLFLRDILAMKYCAPNSHPIIHQLTGEAMSVS